MTLGAVSLEVEGSPFAPVSVLNQMRREAVEQLQALQGSVRGTARASRSDSRRRRDLRGAARTARQARAELHLLVRTPEQLDAAIEIRPASITLDYLDLYGLRPSVERVKASGITARVASPRVLKPGEARILNFLLSLECQILVRSTGILHALRERDHPFLIGDFSLNAANSLSAAEYLKLVCAADAHARSECARRWRTWRGMPARRTSKRSLISTCRFSTRSIACFAGSCRPARVTRIAGVRARSIAWSCGISGPLASGDGGCGLPEHGVRRRGAGSQRASGSVAGGGDPAFPAGVRA